MSRLTRVGGLIQNYLSHSGLSDRVRNETILGAWPEIAGPEIAVRTRAMAIKGGALFIGCASPALAHQLTFLKPRLLEALGARSAEGKIRDIRFQVAELTENAACREPDLKPFRPAPLNASEQTAVENMADAVKDPAARDAFIRVALAARRRDKALKADGWRICEACGTLFQNDEPSACPVCRERVSEHRREMARAVLGEHPWWSQSDVRGFVHGLEEREYRLARRDLIQVWGRRIDELAREFSVRPPGEDDLKRLRLATMQFIMLHQSRIPEQLDAVTVDRLLGRKIGRLLFGS